MSIYLTQIGIFDKNKLQLGSFEVGSVWKKIEIECCVRCETSLLLAYY